MDEFHERRAKWEAAARAVSLLETGEIMNGDMNVARALKSIQEQLWALANISGQLRNSR